jgi:hypothetical protein
MTVEVASVDLSLPKRPIEWASGASSSHGVKKWPSAVGMDRASHPSEVLAPNAARVLFSPSWAGAARIVLVRVEQIVPQPAPSASGRVGASRRRRRRKQRSRDIV